MRFINKFTIINAKCVYALKCPIKIYEKQIHLKSNKWKWISEIIWFNFDLRRIKFVGVGDDIPQGISKQIQGNITVLAPMCTSTGMFSKHSILGHSFVNRICSQHTHRHIHRYPLWKYRQKKIQMENIGQINM